MKVRAIIVLDIIIINTEYVLTQQTSVFHTIMFYVYYATWYMQPGIKKKVVLKYVFTTDKKRIDYLRSNIIISK